ncbi:sulfurtransferase [Roseococcus suduntuyensis]|uniref:3-mercaptopyruvate sulfurtransferase n=1 Tax=Roseococcus suduntuyensis TaxID=455361 RepID=A0A840A970_9PROT|nr:rhodanese-like domain-containing protein [Roseococcus suduntuyensis]MBB3898059.1 thiosulfate/3-mercaptopyruvate sulfurtransferase [Roseococcus suduntuyensis]
MDAIVNMEWLAAHLGQPDLVVFDITKYLPNEPFDGRTKFAEAHIPGAHFFDMDEVADTENPLPHMIPTAARFEKLLGAMGVTRAARVVFYDQKGMQSSPRGWWLMRLFGHDKVAVLDGGLPKWLREGRATASGAPATPAPATYVADFMARRVAGIGDVKRLLEDGSALVLDARAAGRFAGTAPEPRAGLPSGHMPGAANLPFNELLAADGTMLPPDALRARFAAAGADGGKPLVTSCGTGVTACVLALGAVRAGLPEPAVYDGSWTEWASRPETEKVSS